MLMECLCLRHRRMSRADLFHTCPRIVNCVALKQSFSSQSVCPPDLNHPDLARREEAHHSYDQVTFIHKILTCSKFGYLFELAGLPNMAKVKMKFVQSRFVLACSLMFCSRIVLLSSLCMSHTHALHAVFTFADCAA